jgi:hypothetical protein
MSVETKSIVTVAEMARMVGLSRARFYQLIGSAFPHPVYSVSTRRPFFDEESQKICLEVRRRNCGIDGRPILFYARRWSNPVKSVSATPKKRPVQREDPHADLVVAVRSLGLNSVTSVQVAEAVKELFPMGLAGVDQGEVIRSVFVFLMRRDTRDNVR